MLCVLGARGGAKGSFQNEPEIKAQSWRLYGTFPRSIESQLSRKVVKERETSKF